MDTHAREVEELKEELEGLTQAIDRLKEINADLKEKKDTGACTGQIWSPAGRLELDKNMEQIFYKTKTGKNEIDVR